MQLFYFRFSLQAVFCSIVCVCLLSSQSHAFSALEARKRLDGDLAYFSPAKEASRLRNRLEKEALYQCHFGLNILEDGKPLPSSHELLDYFESNDQVLALNGVPINLATQHPWGVFGSWANVKVEVGDTAIWTVKRGEREIDLRIPCRRERKEAIAFLESYADALDRYDFHSFLRRWSHGKADYCAYAYDFFNAVTAETQKGKVKQQDYNSHMTKFALCTAGWIRASHIGGFMTVSDYPDFHLDQMNLESFVTFLNENNAPDSAKRIREALDALEELEQRGFFQSLELDRR